MLSKRRLIALVVTALLVVSASLLASDGAVTATSGGDARVSLIGYQEVPAVSTVARGKLRLQANGDRIEYELEYRDLEGTVTQSHIHFAQRGVNGGISVWLCQTTTNPGPAGTPTCPAPGGKVSGTITAASVVGPTAQGIGAGEFAELVQALRAGVAYANVHSSKFPGGEIRGQVRLNGGKGGDGGHGDH